MFVGVGVRVAVGGTGVAVEVAVGDVGVCVGAGVEVDVGVGVAVTVAVNVRVAVAGTEVGVAVAVGVGVAVAPEFCVGVAVGAGGLYPSVITSKSLAERPANAGFRTSLFQRVSWVPVMYMSEPLSATRRPYFFMARKTFWASAGKEEMSFPAFSRRREPIGRAPVVEPARWEAG